MKTLNSLIAVTLVLWFTGWRLDDAKDLVNAEAPHPICAVFQERLDNPRSAYVNKQEARELLHDFKCNTKR